MEQYVGKVDDAINSVFTKFLRKPTLVRGVVHLLLMLYVARIAPVPPAAVLSLFENAYFKLFVFSLILWTAQFSPSTSLLIALGFMVTMNYISQKPLWEFLENTDPTVAPVAPSKEVAVQAATAIADGQAANVPVVHSIGQKQDTVVIQPTIIDTPKGQAVVNPSVVIATAVVSTPQGEKMVIKPDVTFVNASAPAPAPAPSAAPALAPALAPAPAPAPASAPAAKSDDTVQSGCYPSRRYDLSKVAGFDADASFGEFSA
jgi:hypothetical protein